MTTKVDVVEDRKFCNRDPEIIKPLTQYISIAFDSFSMCKCQLNDGQ